MKILVTGGVGFIGSHTSDALIEKGYHVRILDNLNKTLYPKGIPRHINPEAEFIIGDVRNKATWQKALEGMDAVFHFAAYQDYLPDFSTFFHINTVSTALLYETLLEMKMISKIKKIIVASSQAVMGEGRYKCPECFKKGKKYIYFPQIRLENRLSKGQWDFKCPECSHFLKSIPSDESVVNPCNQYAISKHSQEQIAIQLGQRFSIPSVALRYSIVQGPRQSFYNAYSGAMRIFALSLFFNKRPIIFEDGKQIRDFINIQDVVEANLLVLDNDDANNQVLNVGGGIAWTVNDFYNEMQKTVGKTIDPIISNYYRYGDTRHIFSDTSNLESLGWRPTHDVKESIADYWEYINSQKEMDSILEYAENNMKQLDVIRKVQITP